MREQGRVEELGARQLPTPLHWTVVGRGQGCQTPELLTRPAVKALCFQEQPRRLSSPVDPGSSEYLVRDAARGSKTRVLHPSETQGHLSVCLSVWNTNAGEDSYSVYSILENISLRRTALKIGSSPTLFRKGIMLSFSLTFYSHGSYSV